MARRRSKRRPKRAKGERQGTLRFFIAAFVLFAIGSLLRSSTGEGYGLGGGYIWLLVYLTGFFCTILILARMVLPQSVANSWNEGIRLLIGSTFFYSMAEPLKRVMGAMLGFRGARKAPPGVDQTFGKLGVGFVDSHHSLALSRGSKFLRAAGPGYVRLQDGEQILQVLDLRRHSRQVPVKVMTRDGIQLSATITVLFQAREGSDPGPDEANRLYHVDKRTVFSLSYAGSRSENTDVVLWTERILPIAKNNFVGHLSAMTLDELYPMDIQGPPPIERIEEVMQAALENQLRTVFDYDENQEPPIRILDVIVSELKAREDVIQQRIRNWQANWQRYIAEEQAEGDAEAYERLKIARARAQRDLLESIVDNITMMKQSEQELSDVVLIRMLEAMEEAMANDAVLASLPHNILGTLEHISSWLEEPERRRLPLSEGDELEP
ncbi:MAG: hypothetical protein KDE09_09135 [Anaerolineales bacterium]|nr:hypothetical protein [Anaerolineales bacterium]MCB8962079.1 hypothetical protein [Ardenticatenales bacterium]MCB0006658.1 hypothetical protein [Anaerolineales bacterium]MCB0011882.1 hypothetical protein [Anaerolineales bacterium]MCB0017940.1 hypothetical protein [Anaerolineales bacterium]